MLVMSFATLFMMSVVVGWLSNQVQQLREEAGGGRVKTAWLIDLHGFPQICVWSFSIFHLDIGRHRHGCYSS